MFVCLYCLICCRSVIKVWHLYISLVSFRQKQTFKQLLDELFCHIQNNQGRDRGYQQNPKAEAHNPYRVLNYSGYESPKLNLITVLLSIGRNEMEVMFCLFTVGKQHKARKLDMITLGNRAPRSYMTWLSVTLSVFGTIIVCITCS